jgi:hypothetical protein
MSANNVLRQINDALEDGQIIKDADSTILLRKDSACTLPALTVTGATTQTGNLGVTGNLVMTGNVLPAVVTATAAAGAVTVTGKCSVITTEALTTAQNAFYALTVTATGLVTAAVPIICTIGNGTNSAGTPMLVTCTRTDANTVTISIQNKHASAVALNGTLVISLWILG